jgi:glycosyltransferase involved in cell wall biosynthesis
MHLVIVLPAYNEGKVIGKVIATLPKQLPGINKVTPLVVDDNSKDNTSLKARRAGAACVRHHINMGAGGATVTGLAAARQLDPDIIVMMDSDGQHDPQDLPQMVKPIVDGASDIVLGSRMIKSNQEMPWVKTLGNRVMNIITYCFFGIWVTDSQSGYKALSRQTLEAIRLSTSGYEVHSEIIGEIKRLKLQFCEVSIKTIYTDYSKQKGQLSLNAINIIIGLLLRPLRQS